MSSSVGSSHPSLYWRPEQPPPITFTRRPALFVGSFVSRDFACVCAVSVSFRISMLTFLQVLIGQCQQPFLRIHGGVFLYSVEEEADELTDDRTRLELKVLLQILPVDLEIMERMSRGVLVYVDQPFLEVLLFLRDGEMRFEFVPHSIRLTDQELGMRIQILEVGLRDTYVSNETPYRFVRPSSIELVLVMPHQRHDFFGEFLGELQPAHHVVGELRRNDLVIVKRYVVWAAPAGPHLSRRGLPQIVAEGSQADVQPRRQGTGGVRRVDQMLEDRVGMVLRILPAAHTFVQFREDFPE